VLAQCVALAHLTLNLRFNGIGAAGAGWIGLLADLIQPSKQANELLFVPPRQFIFPKSVFFGFGFWIG
jgi:hypothetical protein